jgi:hypothetical protein
MQERKRNGIITLKSFFMGKMNYQIAIDFFFCLLSRVLLNELSASTLKSLLIDFAI